MSQGTAAIVRHITKSHITIEPAVGYSIVLFNLCDGDVEAIVTAHDGSETLRLLVAGPGPGQNMTIKPIPGGRVDIHYVDVNRDKANGS